jgi:ADP-heptose:LPS heptosyltransferase
MSPPRIAAASVERIAPPWQAVRRLLAVRLDSLGDVLMTTPALAALRESLPQARLTLLASRSGAEAGAHLPMVDEVIACRVPWMPGGGGTQPVRAELGHAECELVDRLVDGGYDAAVVFTVCTESALPAALLLRLAGVPLRLACSREHPHGLLTDWSPEVDTTVATGMRHEVRRQLDLVGTIGCTTADTRVRFALRPADVVRVGARLTAAGIRPGEEPYAVLHPGATAESGC